MGEQMKHVWIFNHYAQDPTVPGGTRHYALARALPQYGWTATVIAASTGHGTDLQRLPPGQSQRLDKIGGVSFQWLHAATYRGNGVSRFQNIAEYTARAFLRSAVKGLTKPNAVVGSSVHPFAALAALRHANRLGVPFVFEIRDLWPQTLIDMGRLKERSAVAWGMRKIERHLCNSASRIVVLLPFAHEYLAGIGVDSAKVVWISNGVELEAHPKISASAFLSEEARHKDAFTLMYLGSFGQANGLDTVLEAMFLLKQSADTSIRLRMIGSGPLQDRLQATVHEMGLTTVSIEPPVPKNEIPKLAAEATAMVLTVRDLPQLYRYGISMNKIFDYLAASKPIIMASNAVNDPVSEAGAGITVPAESPEALAEAIRQMAAMSLSELKEFGRRGREHVEANYSFERLAGLFAAALEEK
jgi:glycosyltransferase involved in cell wall biosynthesis